MPVADHATQARNRIGADFRYGCHNLPRDIDGYMAPDRNYLDVLHYEDRKTYVKNVMSKECRYDFSITDPACTDCEHRGSGEAYARGVIEKANVELRRGANELDQSAAVEPSPRT